MKPLAHKAKKFSLALVTLTLFAASLYLAYRQGSLPEVTDSSVNDSVLRGAAASPLIYTGLKAQIAKLFAVVFNSLMTFMGKSVMLGIVTLALLVELLLLYPSVRIQLKQKKIHLFHKKLIDKFNKGELAVSKTEDELHKLYDVNEKIHHRGAWMVVIQVLLFFFTFWGLSLIVKAPGLITGSWSVLNFSLLSKSQGLFLPVMTALVYFVHALAKIYYKEKEDYISPAQTTMALVFAVVGAVVVYIFAGRFAVALSVYFVTLVSFSTIRYIVVEQHAKKWGAMAQRELIQMLREAGPHTNRFAYFSRVWNHLPIVRHINFNLLEEALSMTLGLMLALSFFGAFQERTDANAYVKQTQPTSIVQIETNHNLS